MTRLGYVTATAFATLLVATVSFVPMPVELIWNASASTPIGLYDLAPPRDLKVGDLVAIMPPAPLADFMVGRSYIGRDVPLLKHVAALPGQRVCRFGPRVTVDGVHLADALGHDSLSRALPVWNGCRRIAKGQLFLMNSSVRDSFDGRYFGALPTRNVIGEAMPIYTDPANDGHFVWRVGRNR